MALPCMESGKTGGAPSRQQPAIGFDGPAQLRNVVAEHFPKAARLEKISLHVDNQERAMLGTERESVWFGRKVYGLTHGRRRCFLRMQGGDDRPDRAGLNSAFDIFGPRLTACRHYARNMPVASTRTAVTNGAASSSFGEGSASPTIGGAAGAVPSMTRLVETRRRIVRQRRDFLDRMKCRRNWRAGDFLLTNIRYLRGRWDTVAHRVDIAADILCCGAQGPGGERTQARHCRVIRLSLVALPPHSRRTMRKLPNLAKGRLRHDGARGYARGRRVPAGGRLISRIHTLRAQAAARAA